MDTLKPFENINIHEKSKVTFEQLIVRHDGDEVVIGRPENESFISISQDAFSLFEKLKIGLNVNEAVVHFKDNGQSIEHSDVIDFLNQFGELGFIRAIDDNGISNQTVKSLFPNLKAKHVKWFFRCLVK